MKKTLIIVILLGLLGGTVAAVSPLLFRIPVIGENILMQVITPPIGEISPLDWSLMASPSFTIPQEGETALLSPSQEIIAGELRVKNISSREVSFTFWSEAIVVEGGTLGAPVLETVLIGKAIEYRSRGAEDYFSDLVVLQAGEEITLTLQIFAGVEESAPFRGVSFIIHPIN